MARVPISKEANETLELWLTQLQEGQIQFADLPLSVSAWYFLGLAEGRASRQVEIERLQHEANILWMRAFTPKERHEEYQRRLDEHFRLEDQRFFDALEAQPAGQPEELQESKEAA